MFFREKRIKQRKNAKRLLTLLLLPCILCSGCTSLVNGPLTVEYLTEEELAELSEKNGIEVEIDTGNFKINNASSYLSEYPDAFYIPENYSNRAEHLISFEILDFLNGNTFLYLYQTMRYEEKAPTPKPTVTPAAPSAVPEDAGKKYVYVVTDEMEDMRAVSNRMVTVLALYNYQNPSSYRTLVSWETDKTEGSSALSQVVYGARSDTDSTMEAKGYAVYFNGRICIYDAKEVLALANGSKLAINAAVSYNFGSEYEEKLKSELGTERSNPDKYQNDITNVSFFYRPGQAAEAVLQLQSAKIVEETEEDKNASKGKGESLDFDADDEDIGDIDENALSDELDVKLYEIRLRFYTFHDSFSFFSDNESMFSQRMRFWYGKDYATNPHTEYFTEGWDRGDSRYISVDDVVKNIPDSFGVPYVSGSYSNGAFQANQVKLVSTGSTAGFYKDASVAEGSKLTGVPFYLQITWSDFTGTYRISGELTLSRVSYGSFSRYAYTMEEEEYYATEEDQKNGKKSKRTVKKNEQQEWVTLAMSKLYTLSGCSIVDIEMYQISEEMSFGSYVSNDWFIMINNGGGSPPAYGQWSLYKVTENEWNKKNGYYNNEYLLCRLLFFDIFSKIGFSALNPFPRMVTLEGESQKTVLGTGVNSVHSALTRGSLYEYVSLGKSVLVRPVDAGGIYKNYADFLSETGTDIILDYEKLNVSVASDGFYLDGDSKEKRAEKILLRNVTLGMDTTPSALQRYVDKGDLPVRVATCVTDERKLSVVFGRNAVYVYDLNGNLLEPGLDYGRCQRLLDAGTARPAGTADGIKNEALAAAWKEFSELLRDNMDCGRAQVIRKEVTGNYKIGSLPYSGIKQLEKAMWGDGTAATNVWTICTTTHGFMLYRGAESGFVPYVPVFQKNVIYETENGAYQQMTRLENGIAAYAVFENSGADKGTYPYVLIGFDNQNTTYTAFDIARAKVIPFAMLDCSQANKGFPEVRADYGENCVYLLKDCYDKTKYETGVKQKSGYYTMETRTNEREK